VVKLTNPVAASYCLFLELLKKFHVYYERFFYDTSIKVVVEMLLKKLNYTMLGEKEDSRDSHHSAHTCFIYGHGDMPLHETQHAHHIRTSLDTSYMPSTTTTTTVVSS
jgi:hypothetical protein